MFVDNEKIVQKYTSHSDGNNAVFVETLQNSRKAPSTVFECPAHDNFVQTTS